jgi:flagellar assembly protein FliH
MSSSSSATKAPRARVLRGLVAPPVALSAIEEFPAGLAVGGHDAAEAAGYDAGYQAGYQEGLQAGRVAAAAEARSAAVRLEQTVAALSTAAAGLTQRQALELAGLEDTIAAVAVDLAAAVIGRELQVAASPGADALARAMALVPAGSPVVARLHPADAELVLSSSASGEEVVPPAVTIVPDPRVEPGGCLLDVGDAQIDAQLGSALDRARAALLGEA